MNGVLGMAQLLQDMKLEAEARDCVEAIPGSGQALVRVVDDMLDMARLEADRLTLEAIPFNVRDVVAEAARLMTPGAEARGIALIWEVADDVPPALGGDPSAPTVAASSCVLDPARLEEVYGAMTGEALKS